MLTHTELAHRLEEWAVGVARSLNYGRYRPWADDIGHEVSVELLVQKEQGLPVPEWPTALDGEPLRLVNRIARSFCPRTLVTLDQDMLVEQEGFTKSTEDDSTRESHRGPHSIALGDEFSDSQIQAMTRVGSPAQSWHGLTGVLC